MDVAWVGLYHIHPFLMRSSSNKKGALNSIVNAPLQENNSGLARCDFVYRIIVFGFAVAFL
jgi:hypothetical protein